MEAAKARKATNSGTKKTVKAEKPAGEAKTYQQLLAEQKINLKQEEKQENA